MKNLFTILLLGLAINSTAQIPTNGLIGYWPFNSNANDESGNGNNGIVHGARLTNDRFGNANSAYYFDGNRQYIISKDTINISGNMPRSISVWVKWFVNNYSPEPGEHDIMGWGDICNNGNFNWLNMHNFQGQNLPYGYALFNGHYMDLNASITTNKDSWTHIVFLYDGTVMKFFIDGKKSFAVSYTILETIPTVLNIGYKTRKTCLGAEDNGGWNTAFKGCIDDISIYNRVLNEEEIADLYDKSGDWAINPVISNSSLIIWNGIPVTLKANRDSNLTYKWFRNKTEITGATSDTCVVSESGYYKVVETNKYGHSETSNAITVLNPGDLYIPDENFRNALIQAGIDANNDELISYDECIGITELNVTEKNISDLSGIEAFVDLNVLNCSNNGITSLDISGNAALAYLYCSDNQLTSLKISNDSVLTGLYCHNNQLDSLDVSGCSSLESLSCENNKLTSLDVTGCIGLLDLSCGKNLLTSLNLSTNLKLPAPGIMWTHSMDLSYMPTLYNVLVSEIPFPYSYGWLGCFYQGQVDTTGSPNVIFVTSANGLVSIPDANLKNALIEAGIDTDNDGEISFRESIKVTSLDLSSKNISDLTGIEAFTNLDYLDCSNNQLLRLSLINNAFLKTLDCSNNSLDSITIYPFPEVKSSNRCNYYSGLDFLNCSNNQLTRLGISNCKDLKSLDCSNNQLTSLFVSSNSDLKDLNCSQNLLTSLDVSANTKLISLGCGSNQLTSLNISRNKKLLSTLSGTHSGILDLSSLPDLVDVCVWELPFPPAGNAGQVNITGSPNINFTDAGCNVMNVYFPDAAFKEALIYSGVDTNGDGEISYEECESVTDLYLSYPSDISDLTGIEAFANLLTLFIEPNYNLTRVDVSDLLSLQYVELSDMPNLQEVCVWDVSNCTVSAPGSPDLIVSGNCNATDISPSKEVNKLTIYPNPAEGILTVEIENTINTNIEIYNLNGSRIYSKVPLSTKEKIDVSGYPAGLYLVKVIHGRNIILGKVVKK